MRFVDKILEKIMYKFAWLLPNFKQYWDPPIEALVYLRPLPKNIKKGVITGRKSWGQVLIKQ